MRRTAQVSPPPPPPTVPSASAGLPAPRTPMPAAPAVRRAPTSRIDELDGIRDLRQPVSFSVNLGYQIDGSRPSGQSTLDGRYPNTTTRSTDFATLRSYAYGEGFASERGVGIPSLSGYFSARFEVARKLEAKNDDESETHPVAPPIATWFERSGIDVRTAWGEVKDFLPKRWGLRYLRVRAGDQFVYGVWPVHIFGATAAWESSTLTLVGFAGVRRSDYTRALGNSQPGVAGGTIRVDLRGLSHPVPIAASASILALTDSDDTGQPATQSTQLQADWRPRRDIALIGQARFLDGHSANQRLELRARYKEVTNLVFDVTRREEDDWRWDPTLVTLKQDDITEARRYLDLGPVLPQIIAAARGGTLIAENVDLFARIAAAADLRDPDVPASPFTTSYLELGGAAEVRLRRQVAIGLSALTRQTHRVVTNSIEDRLGQTGPLPDGEAIGEEGFTELGTTLRMTLGARKFSSALEVYGRRTQFGAVYHDPMVDIRKTDLRGGGRVTIDAWLGSRLRLYMQYDASSELDNAPEINGYKSLRLVASGVY